MPLYILCGILSVLILNKFLKNESLTVKIIMYSLIVLAGYAGLLIAILVRLYYKK